MVCTLSTPTALCTCPHHSPRQADYLAQRCICYTWWPSKSWTLSVIEPTFKWLGPRHWLTLASWKCSQLPLYLSKRWGSSPDHRERGAIPLYILDIALSQVPPKWKHICTSIHESKASIYSKRIEPSLGKGKEIQVEKFVACDVTLPRAGGSSLYVSSSKATTLLLSPTRPSPHSSSLLSSLSHSPNPCIFWSNISTPQIHCVMLMTQFLKDCVSKDSLPTWFHSFGQARGDIRCHWRGRHAAEKDVREVLLTGYNQSGFFFSFFPNFVISAL